MKLKTKLIPLSSLGVFGTIVAPISLTSCGNGNTIGRAFDLAKNFYPTIECHEHELLSIHDINELYAKKIAEDPEVIVQDYLWSKSWTGFAFEQFLFWQKLIPGWISDPDTADKLIVAPPRDIYSSDIEVISNLEVEMQTAKWNGVDWTFPTLSFTLDYNSKILDTVLSQEYFGEMQATGYINGICSGKLTFYKVPFYVIERKIKSEEQEMTFNVLSFEPFYEWMSNTLPDGETIDKEPLPWIINTSSYSSVNGEITYLTGLTQRIADDWKLNEESTNENPSWVYDDLSLEVTVGRLFLSPYYLHKIQIKEER